MNEDALHDYVTSSFRLERSQREALRQFAKANHRTPSQEIRRLIDVHIVNKPVYGTTSGTIYFPPTNAA